MSSSIVRFAKDVTVEKEVDRRIQQSRENWRPSGNCQPAWPMKSTTPWG